MPAIRQFFTAMLLLCTGAPVVLAQPLNAGPYVPTPQSIVDQMLNMASIGPGDFVFDLGSGDGRLVRQAAKRFGARGFGVDIDGDLVKLAAGEAKKDGVADRVTFQEKDLFDTDIRPASVVTLYLLPVAVRKLRDKMISDLRPGTRIVSHDYYWDEWQADNQITFDVPEKTSITGTPQTTVYLWIVPARAGGRWQVKAVNNEAWDLALKQDFQMLAGTATSAGRTGKLRYATLRGDEINFGIPVAGKPTDVYHQFNGRVVGDRIEGKVDFAGGAKQVAFTATRVGPAARLPGEKPGGQ